jgi:hypothetical protein
MISWAGLLLDYGPWVNHRGGDVDDVPGHNSAYKRDILLSSGPELGALMEIETMFHWALRQKGHRFIVEPRAVLYHTNVSRPSVWLAERWHAGRVFAATRSRGWSWRQRLLFTAGSPLIPLIRIRRILRHIRRGELQQRLLPGILPALVLSLLVSAAGEMIGYATGPGDSWNLVYRLELYKLRYVSAREREAILTRALTLGETQDASTPLQARHSGTGA